MVDHPVTMTDERRAAGASILRLTDSFGFGAVGAAWVYSSEADIWCFVLVTPMLDSKGPRWIHQRLLPAFAKAPLPTGVTPLDLRVVSPRDEWFRKFPVKAKNNLPGPLPEMELRDLRIPGMTPVDFVYIYRMDFAPQFAGDRAAIFDRKVAELIAA